VVKSARRVKQYGAVGGAEGGAGGGAMLQDSISEVMR